ncbi:MAG TPA: peptide MFS transporter [Nevskiaceae bacterium]|nr:peptide MFS transporter [Nevskiaceae bacterium]
MTIAAAATSEEFLGHPKGLYVCFFTEMWERFSFYGMKSLLVLYLVKHHLFSDSDSLAIQGAYGGMVYAIPVIGGLVADRWLGMRKSVVLGGILLCLGHLGMSVEGHAAQVVDGHVQRDEFALLVFYASLALIISGVGFLKPNISTIVGKLYPDGDPRRESGFTLFYAGINVGALFASLICGYLGEAYGWSYGFGAAGIGMLAGLAMFISGQKYLMGHAEPRDAAALAQRVLGPLTLEWSIYLAAVLALPAIFLLMKLGSAVLYLQFLLIGSWLVWLAWYVVERCNRVQREQMLAVVLFTSFCLLFFALYEQTYGSWVLFTDRMLDKDLFPAFVIREGQPLPWSIAPLIFAPLAMGIALRMRAEKTARGLIGITAALGTLIIVRDCVVLPQTAESLTYLGALFIVLLSPLFAWLWPFLDRRGLNPSKPLKSAIGLAFSGLAFLPLAAANAGVTDGHLGSVWWLVLAYLLIEIGEVSLSPIGLAAVTDLSVPAVVGVMMGAWWLATSFSEQAAAALGKLAALELPADGKIDFTVAVQKYGDLFHQMVWLGLGAAVFALVITPLVRRWMHGVR